MSAPLVSVHIVTWNSMRYLPRALFSLFEQTRTDFSVIIIDNNSNDDVISFVRANYPKVTLIRNVIDVGFSRAHNQAIILAKNRWQESGAELAECAVVVMNPDVILTPSYIDEALKCLERRPQAAGVAGKLLRLESSDAEGENEPIKTNIIDSTGLKILRGRRVVDRGAGENNEEKIRSEEQVFGIPGTLAAYRMSALNDAAHSSSEFFDEDMFAYKEDADLSWRLRLLGWQMWFTSGAIAYHHRRVRGDEKRSWLKSLAEWRDRPAKLKFLSVRNQLLFTAKNDHLSNFLKDAPFIILSELKRFVAALFLSPRTLAAYGSACRLFPGMLKKRFSLFKRARASPKEIRRWMK